METGSSLPGRTVLAALVAAWAAAGCMPDNKGVSPPSDLLHYPTAAILAPDGDHLAVANSNFDLAFNSGTLILFDLDAIANGLLPGCPDEGCEPVEESEYVLADDTVSIGSYSSFLANAPDGGRMYLTVRGNNSLTWFDVDASAAPGRRLTCFDPDDPPRSRKCDTEHTIHSGLPADPYAVTTSRATYALDGDEVDVDWIFVSSLTDSEVTVFKAEVSAETGRDLAPTHVLLEDSFPSGVSAIEAHPLIPSIFYATTRSSSALYTFGFASDPQDFDGSTRIVLGATIPVRVLGDGHDSRDLAFSGDGSMAFVTNRSPNSLLLVDTSPDAWGWPENDVVGVVELDAGPSLVTVWSPPGLGEEWAYVTCYDADRIIVVDPVSREAVDVILTGNGPHVFVTDPARLLGYLVNFIESTVMVVDLDPGSPHWNSIRATLGIPEQPRSND